MYVFKEYFLFRKVVELVSLSFDLHDRLKVCTSRFRAHKTSEVARLDP